MQAIPARVIERCLKKTFLDEQKWMLWLEFALAYQHWIRDG